ncbi:MAG: beta-ketoacyl synthase N-terminal-like domain-containing protein, partial [Oscillospiraceae bacterium]
SESEDPKRASIPFDAKRQGFVMGEGAGALVIEEYEMAKARNANIIAEIVGYGSTCDAFHMTAPVDTGEGAANCIKDALKDANIKAEDISYINAHGTSTPMNDKCETLAVKLALGEHSKKVIMSSTKSMTGHLLGAAGGIEAIFTALSLKEQIAPPPIGYLEKDEDCDLNISANKTTDFSGDYAMSNSLGFGGHNATIILKRY